MTEEESATVSGGYLFVIAPSLTVSINPTITTVDQFKDAAVSSGWGSYEEVQAFLGGVEMDLIAANKNR